MLFATLTLMALSASSNIAIAKHRRKFDQSAPDTLQYGQGSEFSFRRFQSQAAMKRAFERVRSSSSFRWHQGSDGRHGYICSTKLGGDWVLAESEQIAPSCTCEEVLMAYLSGILQLKWNADKVSTIRVTRRKSDSDVYYRQDLTLRSQRVITSSTGEMRYSQKIIVDKVGRNCFCALVTLDPEQPSTAKKPFNTLTVYVGLEQRANDVNIYAAGVMEVNRKVVPHLIIFDASGIAGDMAGKGTLWLSGHFMERKRAAAAAASQRATDHAEKVGAGLAQATRAVQHRLSHMWDSLRLFWSTEQSV
jgi:hypothetical protein